MAAKSGVVLPVAPALPAAETTWLAWAGWMAAALPLCLMGYAYYDSLAYMTDLWVNDENYGHGLLVPLISLYLIWQRRDNIRSLVQPGSWLGLVLVGVGILLYVVGELATVYLLLHLSFWCVLVGLLVACLGRPAVTVMAFPLGYLLTAVPLPQFLYQGLSGKLQLISSALGVGCLQFLGITAFRDGNVIDLGPIQLQVVDACSGLRYLFPLATLALLCAYLFNDRMWKRVLLFLSSLPISILLNGFRIGMIGVLVEHFGQGAAEGFYHLFEGWVLFMVSLAILVLEMWLLKRGGGDPSNTGLFQFPASTASGKALSEAAHSGAPCGRVPCSPRFSAPVACSWYCRWPRLSWHSETRRCLSGRVSSTSPCRSPVGPAQRFRLRLVTSRSCDSMTTSWLITLKPEVLRSIYTSRTIDPSAKGSRPILRRPVFPEVDGRSRPCSR